MLPLYMTSLSQVSGTHTGGLFACEKEVSGSHLLVREKSYKTDIPNTCSHWTHNKRNVIKQLIFVWLELLVVFINSPG
jgi:hypothetical protein